MRVYNGRSRSHIDRGILYYSYNVSTSVVQLLECLSSVVDRQFSPRQIKQRTLKFAKRAKTGWLRVKILHPRGTNGLLRTVISSYWLNTKQAISPSSRHHHIIKRLLFLVILWVANWSFYGQLIAHLAFTTIADTIPPLQINVRVCVWRRYVV